MTLQIATTKNYGRHDTAMFKIMTFSFYSCTRTETVGSRGTEMYVCARVREPVSVNSLYITLSLVKRGIFVAGHSYWPQNGM